MNRSHVLASALVVLVVLCGSFAATAATVTLQPAQNGGTGHDLVVPVVVDPADGVTAMDFLFTYDPAVLQATGVYLTAFTDGFALSSNLATPGQVSASLSFGVGPLAGKGEVAWVVFRVLGATGTSSALTWVNCTLNAGAISSTCVNGSISVVSRTAVMSVPDGLKTGPATTITVPISLAPADGAEGIDITLKFNSTILTATAVNKTALTGSMTLTPNLATPGEVKISLFGTTPLSGSGPIAEVVFSVIGVIGEASPINLTRGSVNEGGISTNLDDGLVSICDNVDRDGDGVTACNGDCVPTDGAVYPGATEICDGKDNDCDGLTDDADPGVAAWTWYPDADGDGYGAAAGSITVCTPPAQPPDWRKVDGDCDDADLLINPGRAEACNGKDDDCNAGTADGAGETWYGQACDGTDVDLCAEGAFTCTAGAQACNDANDADPDLCNGADDDCNPATADGSGDPGLGVGCDGPDSDLCLRGRRSARRAR